MLRDLVQHGALVQAVLDTVEVGIVACDAAGRLTVFNAAARAVHGLDPDGSLTPDEWAGHYALRCADGTTPLAADRVPLLRALVEGRVVGAEVVIAPTGRPPVRVRCDGRALRAPDGALAGAVVAMTDVTAALAAEKELRHAREVVDRTTEALSRSEELVRTAFEHGPVAMCWVDPRGAIEHANPALRRLLSMSTRALHGAPLAGLVVPADRDRLEVAVRAAGAGTTLTEPVEVRLVRTDGVPLWVELTSNRVPGGYVLVQLADVDARKQREHHLERLAATDSLTGLANRPALTAALTDRLAPGSSRGELVLLFLDLDDFKTVNDTLGHAAGDLVLVEVARRLQAAVRPGDLVARLHGDEFVVVCAETAPVGTGMRTGDALLRRVHAALHPPVHLPSGSHHVRASIGLAVAVPGEHPSVVLARADRAMYAGKPGVAPRAASTADAAQPRLADLVATAVQEERLSLVHQPVIDLATGRWIGVEALVRMVDRKGHLVMPDAFIPVAESGGSIHELGDWVLRTSCVQAAAWKDALPAGHDFVVGVNLSPRQLDDPELLDRLDDALLVSGLEPTALALELTERLLTADSPRVRATLSAVRERGVHLAADDFGTGYSSVSYLADLPLDIIKLDRSWTSRLARTGAASRLAVGVARLAASTGMVVVAEGIEVVEEMAAVQEHGCTLGQGYLFAKPLATAEFTERLLAPPLPLPRQATGG